MLGYRYDLMPLIERYANNNARWVSLYVCKQIYLIDKL